MAAIRWKLAQSGDWSTAGNWNPGTVPGAGDSVTVNVSGAYTVTDYGTVAAASLTFAASGATFQNTGALTVGTLTLTTGTFVAASGGSLIGATVALGNQATFAASGGTLSGVTFKGTLDLSPNSSYLTVVNGLSVTTAAGSGAGTVNLTGQYSNITFSGTQSFDNATLNIGNSGGGYNYIYAQSDGGSGAETLTLGTSLTVKQTAASSTVYLYSTGAAILNKGTITAAANLGAFTIQGDTFTNQGGIAVSNHDTMTINTTAFASSGTISETNATLNINAATTWTTPATISASGGAVNLNAAVTNTGSTFTVTASNSGVFNLNSGGSITGGTVVDANGAMVFNGGTLNGVTYDGTLNLSNVNSGTLYVTGGLQMAGANGSGKGTVNVTQYYGSLQFNGTQTFDNATVNFGAGNTYDYIQSVNDGNNAAETLTLGANLAIVHAGSNQGYSANLSAGSQTTILNKGTITAGVSGGLFNIDGNAFTNQGSITVSNTDTVNLDPTTFTNSSTGTVTVTGGSILNLGSFTSTGTISETNSTINLNGATTGASLSKITASGGSVNIAAGVANAGTTFTVNASNAGVFVLQSGGSITGGTIVDAGGALAFNGGTLNGVAYDGTLNVVGNLYYQTVFVTGGLTMAGANGTGKGTVNLSQQYGVLQFSGTQTFDNATVNFGSSSSNEYIQSANDGNNVSETLTLGANLTIVHAGNNQGYFTDLSAGAQTTILNKGTITAAVSGGLLYIDGNAFTNQGGIAVSNTDTVTLAPTTFTNSTTGTVTVASGGILNLGAFTSTGSIGETNATINLNGATTGASLNKITASGGVVNIAAAVTNTATTFTVHSSNAGVFALNSGGSITGGTIVDGSGAINFGGGTLNGVTFNGRMNLSTYGANATISNGLTLAGANGTGLGTVNLTGNYSSLNFVGTQTFDNATVNFGTTGGAWDYIYASSDGAAGPETLTLGTNLKIVQAAGSTGYVDLVSNGAAILNKGTITAGLNGGNFYIEGDTFTNQGSIAVSNADTMTIRPTTFSNTGSVTVTGGGILNLNAFTNTGTISETNSTINLNGATTGAALSSITASGGAVNINTAVANAGSTFTVQASNAGVFNLQSGGSITGGTIVDAGGAIAFVGGTLSGVTYDGTLNLGTSNASLNVINGLTMAGASGTGAGTVNLTGQSASLTFTGTQTFDNATVNIGNAAGTDYIYANSDGASSTESLTLGANVRIVQTGGSAALYSNGAGIVNNGSIAAGVSGSSFSVIGTSFTNQGQITVSNSDYLAINTTKFVNSGTLVAQSGTSLSFSNTTFTNTGSLTIGAGLNVTLNPTTWTNLSGNTLTGGTYEVDAGATLELGQNKIITADNANIILSGAGSTIQSYSTSQSKEISFDSRLTSIGTTGALHLLAGRSWTATTAFTDSGLLELGGGAFATTSLIVGSTGTVRGFGSVTPAFSNGGLVEAQGGTLVLQGAVSGSGALQVDAGATLELKSTASQTVTFNGFKGTLQLDAPTGYSGTLASLAAGDTIDLGSTNATGAAISGSSLIVSLSGGGTLSYNVSGAAANTRFKASSDGHGGTNLTMYGLAQASAAAPNPIAFGNAHVGDTKTQTLTIGNTAPANGTSETLDGSVGGATAGLTASGSFTGLAAGASDTSHLIVGLDTSSAGAKSGTVTVTLASDGAGVDGLPNTALPSQTVQASGAVYAYAAPTFSTTTLNLGAARVGDSTAASTVTIGDGSVASAYQESLVYAAGSAPAGFSVTSGGTNTVASGATAGLGLALNTATAGNFTGSQLTVGLTSTGAGTSGLADTALPGQTVTLNGKVYATAVAQLATTTLNFGVVHVGDTVSTALGLTNAASGALTDVLTGGFGTVSGPFSGSGTLGAGLAAGQSGSLTVALNTSASGVQTGSAALSLSSHDGDLADVSVAAGPVQLTGTVDNYATAGFQETSGGGTLTQNGNAYTLDLGQIFQGASAPVIDLAVLNTAAGLADLLSGSFSVSGDAAFLNSGLSAFSGLGAGQADTSPTVTLSTSQTGTFTETITLQSTGSNASGYSGALANETFTITGTIVTNGQTYTLTRTPTTINAGSGNDTFIATNGVLYAGDQINGGGGTNTLQLSGAGTFDLRAPRTLSNITVISAKEGQSAYKSGSVNDPSQRQTIYLRAGLDAAVNVASATLDPTNRTAPGITIVGAANNAVITLGNGNDIVTLGGAGETVLGGGGNDLFNVTKDTIGATIDGGTGVSKLAVTGGGAVTMGSNITRIASVTLGYSSGQPDYVFTANAIQNLAIVGSGGNDTIVVGDASQKVTLSGAVERVKATAAQAGALVTGGSGSNVLEITTGGTATLNANTTNVVVNLDQAATLTLSRKSGVSAVGSAGNDTIKAAATGQTIGGGLGTDTLFGFSGFGTTFMDTTAGLNGDTIRSFGGNDLIDLTDVAFVQGSTTVGYTQGSGKGVLSLNDGSHMPNITLIGTFDPTHFTAMSDGHNGTIVSYS